MTDQAHRESTKKLFDVLDGNGTGFIEPEELDNFLQIMGVADEDQRQEQIPILLNRMDLDGDGRISFEEFYQVATAMGLDIETTLHAAESTGTVASSTGDFAGEDEASAKLFDELDTDHDGFIEASALVSVLRDRCGISEQRLQDETLRDHFRLSRKDKISRASFIRKNQGLIRRRSSLFRLFNESNSAPQTYASSCLTEKKRNQLWAIFTFADDDRDGVATIQQLANVIAEKKTADILHLEDMDVLELLISENPQETEFDFNAFCLEFVALSEANSQYCNFVNAARAFSSENKKLRKRLSVVEQENELAKKSIESRASVEQLELLKAHDATEEELRSVLEDVAKLRRENKSLLQKVDALRGENEILDRAHSEDNDKHKPASPRDALGVSMSAEEITDMRQKVDDLNAALVHSMREHAELMEEKRREIDDLNKEKADLKKDKESLEVRLMELARHSNKKSMATADETLRSVSLQQELQLVREQLDNQKKLAFDLTNEKEMLERRLDSFEGTSAADTGLGQGKEEMEILNTKLHSALQDLRIAHERNLALEAELGLTRGEKHVREVVTRSAVGEVAGRAPLSDREGGSAARSTPAKKEAAGPTPAEKQVAERVLATVNAENTPDPLLMQYIRSIVDLKKENRTLKKTVKKLHGLYKQSLDRSGEVAISSASTANQEALVSKLRAELAEATGQIGQLAIDLDAARNGQPNEGEMKKLRAELDATTLRLDAAINQLRKNKNTACVQVVRTRKIEHTRYDKEGKREVVGVDDSQPIEVQTYFTDDGVRALKIGPWSDYEDRVLLQTQLRVGGDWVAIAQALPGRTDVEVKKRWVELTQALVEHSQSHRTSRLFTDRDTQIGSSLLKHHESVMSQRSEGTYELASIENEEASISSRNASSKAGAAKRPSNSTSKTAVLATV